MGCTNSKLDDLPAVALCRQRCDYLDQAIHQRYALADAHRAYIQSLRSIGNSLSDFVRRDFNPSDSPPTTKHKSAAAHHPPASAAHGHLQFNSEDDSDSDESGSLHHSDDDHFHHDNRYHDDDFSQSPSRQVGGFLGQYGQSPSRQVGGFLGPYGGGGGEGFMQMNFMRNKATPSVVYEQRPFSPEIVHQVGESSSASYYNSYYNSNPYMNPNPNPPFPYYGYANPNYGGGGGGGGGGGYYSGSSPPGAAASSSKPPPPPPSPPRPSAWDFLNPFQSEEKYFTHYTPSQDSREVREAEGIPDLEDEDYYQHEVVKKVHGNQKFAGDGRNHRLKAAAVAADDGIKRVDEPDVSMYQTRPSVSVESERGVEYEVHVVDKKVVVDDEDRSKEGRGGSRDVFEVVRDIEVQFQRASESGHEIEQLLEAGKVPHSNHRRHASKMLHMVTPSLSLVYSQPSTSKGGETSSSADKDGPAQPDFEEELRTRSKNLSSTLQKLHLWEKKLHNEVKAEEKMRVIHDRTCRKLKRLDERGAEAYKVDTTRTLIRGLSTKIRIAIQVVDRISLTINKIRDEELYPQLNELIQGLTRMWKCMLECHRIQCQAIREARGLGPIGSSKKLGDSQVEATMQFGRELINWTFRFSNWISAQKGYVRALNNWLRKCLPDEPEETVDGIAPFSPGRLGAPPIFVICHQWTQAMDNIPEKEVVDAMRMFATNVLQTWENDKDKMRQRMMANKDLERKVRNMDKEDQKMHKEIQAFDKKMVTVSGETNSLPLSGNIVYQSDTSNPTIQASLQRIFDAMEKFTATSLKACEELLQRSEEVRVSRERESQET